MIETKQMLFATTCCSDHRCVIDLDQRYRNMHDDFDHCFHHIMFQRLKSKIFRTHDVRVQWGSGGRIKVLRQRTIPENILVIFLPSDKVYASYFLYSGTLTVFSLCCVNCPGTNNCSAQSLCCTPNHEFLLIFGRMCL